MQTSIDKSSKFITSTSNFIWRQKAENYNNMFTFLHQTDEFIKTGYIASQTFWQWSDDIKPKDDITPFGILLGPPGYTQAFPNLRPGPLNCLVWHKNE